MKGPGMRLDLDVRRAWRCPECGAERRTAGDRTVVSCHVCGAGRLMSLVDPVRPLRKPPRPLNLVIALHPDDVELPPPTVIEETPEPELAPEPYVQNEEPVMEPSTPEIAEAPQEKPDSDQRSGRKKSRRRSKQRSRDQKSSDVATPETSTPTSEAASPKSVSPETFGDGV